MGSALIVISTFLVILSLGIRNARRKKRLVVRFISLIKSINKTYVSLFKEKALLARVTQGTILILAEVLTFSSIYQIIMGLVKIHSNIIMDSTIKVLVILVSIIIIHYSIGYILLIITGINRFFHNVEHKETKTNLLLSYFLLSTFFASLIIFPQQFGNEYIIGLIGIIICYMLNLEVLINLIKDPRNIKSSNNEEQSESFTRVIVASILIIIMIILNLFLGVCLINSNDPGAFTGNPSNFDLFYYTIITFTTVGYGDISPVSIQAKISALIISVTSVVCITIFLSTILSYRDKV